MCVSMCLCLFVKRKITNTLHIPVHVYTCISLFEGGYKIYRSHTDGMIYISCSLYTTT